jgi:hypothetical protein
MLVAMDQDLLELAIRARGGHLELAAALHHDPPAIDWWRRTGVPDEMRTLVADLARHPDDGGREQQLEHGPPAPTRSTASVRLSKFRRRRVGVPNP